MFKFLNIFRRKKPVLGKIVSLPVPPENHLLFDVLKTLNPIQLKILKLLADGPMSEEELLKRLNEEEVVDEGKWQTASVECPLCARRWVPVWPVDIHKLECPTCENMIEPIIINAL